MNKDLSQAPQDYLLIQTTEDLQVFCTELLKSAEPSLLAIDTEFMSEKTYWPQLCLIQLAYEKGVVLIDPLAPSMDLSPLFPVLQHPSILKAFHSARQDLEIFYILTGHVPRPLFDTQVAGMVCGLGESISYENLVEKILKKKLDKSARLTDWSKRPLSQAQLSYAVQDVLYLKEAYPWFQKKFQQNGREAWIQEEMEILLNPETYHLSLEKVWLRLKGKSFYGLKSKTLAVLKALATWREIKAQQMNIPRRRVVEDKILFDLALFLPKNKQELTQARGFPPSFLFGKEIEAVIEVIVQTLKTPSETWPHPVYPPITSIKDSIFLDFLKFLLTINCKEQDVVPRMVALTNDLEIFACQNDLSLPFLKGWRLDIFGKDALDLKEGKLALKFLEGKIHKIR